MSDERSNQLRLPALIVHGGAGHFDVPRRGPARRACERALRVGLELLRRGESALDAVQAAVRVLEDDPCLNAGIGSSLTAAGTVECDAAIMDGSRRAIGAVAAMEFCGRAIDVARAVLDDGRHAFLCGEGAWAFARSVGIEPAAAETLICDYRRQQLAEMLGDGGGTVGACAVDVAGRVAAATSTGGTTGKLPGRIGDTPLSGCGTYADAWAATSATGHGEALMRITAARLASWSCEQGATARDAALRVLEEVRGLGSDSDVGIIIATCDGGLGAAHNTDAMPFAAGRVEAGEIVVLASGLSTGAGGFG